MRGAEVILLSKFGKTVVTAYDGSDYWIGWRPKPYPTPDLRKEMLRYATGG